MPLPSGFTAEGYSAIQRNDWASYLSAKEVLDAEHTPGLDRKLRHVLVAPTEFAYAKSPAGFGLAKERGRTSTPLPPHAAHGGLGR
jgi:hypothetical protein